MPRGWVKDISWEILERDKLGKKQHWTKLPPDANGRVPVQFRRCMSFNIAINMFGADPDAEGDKSNTPFLAYYETPIVDMLRKFANRFENTIPITLTDLDEKEELRTDTVMQGARLIYAAALLAEPHRGLLMKHLYVKELFVPNHQTLQSVLRTLDLFVRICPWACVPFLNYSWNDKDKAIYPRPDLSAYDAHLKGHQDPDLPGKKKLGGSIMGIENLDYEGFTYYDTTGSIDKCKEYRRTRCFAATWGFIDPLDIIERIAARDGRSDGVATPISDCVEHGCDSNDAGVGIRSSGNGYRCVGGVCTPSNPSSFCVSSSCQ